jgi:hypothetical protein
MKNYIFRKTTILVVIACIAIAFPSIPARTQGLFSNVSAEAVYPYTNVDQTGKRLNGINKYVLRFDKGQMPPVNAFWSVTMYGADRFFVANPINRYAIGDRTQGLKYNPDGSLDIYIQHSAPKGKESNWLPAPQGDFNLMLRMYMPKPEVLNGTYKLPRVKRINP